MFLLHGKIREAYCVSPVRRGFWPKLLTGKPIAGRVLSDRVNTVSVRAGTRTDVNILQTTNYKETKPMVLEV